MSDLLSLLGVLAAALTLVVGGWRCFAPPCRHTRPLNRSASMWCRRPRWHPGPHRTARFGKGSSVAFWRRDTVWRARRHPVRWWHRQRALWKRGLR